MGPSGMGICFVELAAPARDVIGRLVTVREPTMFGLGPEEQTGIRARGLLVPSNVPGLLVRPEVRRREPSVVFCLVNKKRRPH